MDVMQQRVSTGLTQEPFHLLLIPPSDAPYCVEFVKELLNGAQLSGPVLWSFEDLRVMLSIGRMQLWLTAKTDVTGPVMFMLTEINVYPAGRICNICLIGGRYFRAISRRFFPNFIGWCRENNIDFIEASTNPTIAQALKKLGFSPTGVRMHFSIAPFN